MLLYRKTSCHATNVYRDGSFVSVMLSVAECVLGGRVDIEKQTKFNSNNTTRII